MGAPTFFLLSRRKDLRRSLTLSHSLLRAKRRRRAKDGQGPSVVGRRLSVCFTSAARGVKSLDCGSLLFPNSFRSAPHGLFLTWLCKSHFIRKNRHFAFFAFVFLFFDQFLKHFRRTFPKVTSCYERRMTHLPLLLSEGGMILHVNAQD